MSTVLIVDDHASFRLQARSVLEAGGHQVLGEAADGRSALEQARALGPQIVLLDIGLPDIDGFEVARQLTAQASPPIVVLTSSRDAASYGPRIADSRVAGFIAKDELSGPALTAVAGEVPRG
jgi:DNA-binding NarL/FixJ family response regulator